ncbi:membrane protein insertase YidC [Galbitalea sp. SE-J8]|uniref:YidC/Oxa1 family membrane protein insertase n=1 Tax=Galbitalea sp. SE-J8 TaxID=3054952 RepID=UPI00259D1989|nr:membrane protein insertase YidC [Galbitalea sp. SE-J8]MDM4762914.1 membrane protein insertase YidC [Galbitalea sp. SE-J8]
MNPIDAAFAAAYRAVEALSALLAPLLGASAAAGAIVLITLVLRAALIPVGVSQVRADIARRRIAPQLAAVQKRWAKKPERLATEMRGLYAREGVSPFAGVLPALAQLPVVSLVYGVFTHAQIAGGANALLAATVVGVPLGTTASAAVASPIGIAVYAAIVVVLVVVGILNRRQAVRLAATPPTGIARVLGWMPLATAAIALVVPFAAAIYLAVSSVWGLVERTIVRRALTRSVAV